MPEAMSVGEVWASAGVRRVGFEADRVTFAEHESLADVGAELVQVVAHEVAPQRLVGLRVGGVGEQGTPPGVERVQAAANLFPIFLSCRCFLLMSAYL